MTEEIAPELRKAAQEEFEPTKLKAGEELPPAVRQAMMEFMVPAIAKGVWEGIYALPDEARPKFTIAKIHVAHTRTTSRTQLDY